MCAYLPEKKRIHLDSEKKLRWRSVFFLPKHNSYEATPAGTSQGIEGMLPTVGVVTNVIKVEGPSSYTTNTRDFSRGDSDR